MSDAVALFLIPSLAAAVVVDGFAVPFSFFVFLSSSEEEEEEGFANVLVSDASFSACFRFFLLPGAFFSACVRPFSFNVFRRRLRRAMSVGAVGRIGITSFSA